ncbi:acylamino-acid-releasing enzyme-like isoform X2 [Pseudomyrmex gracilis]|nr:acylamino-acid-releasing enzyme-like isoform X2 [Pseudomyrmex gracilis]
MKKLVDLYKSVAAYPDLVSARIQGTASKKLFVQSVWKQRNLERKTNQTFLRNYDLSSDLTSVSATGFPIDVTTELMSALTKNEEHRAILRQATVDNTTKQFIEIWDKEHLMKNYDLSALDVHGDVYTDMEFSSFEWSPDDTKLLYVAEKKLPKSEPFYKQKPLDKKDKEKKEDEISVGNEYIYKPHWGEQLVGKHRPVVAVLDTTTDSITILSGIPDDLSPGQVTWTKDQDVIGVAWRHEPQYLGLTACTNRYSWIFLLRNGEYQKLSDDDCAVQSPRISPDGNYLVWLQRKAGAVPHHNAHKLMMRDLRKENHTEEIVEVVEMSKTIKNNKKFYGIYRRLSRRCWSDDSQYLFFSTPQRNNIVSYIVNIKTKDVTEINNDGSSLVVLDVKENVIAFLNISLTQPANLMVGRFELGAADSGDIPRIAISTPVKIDGFEEIIYEPNEYIYNNDDSIKQFNYIYFGPNNGKTKSVPFIVVPHGGPHSNYTNVHILDYSFFVKAGFAVVQVNYRGSTGMGSATVEYLQGKVGDVDVKDCITATEEAIEKYPWLDRDRIGLYGGSHGGFLVTHLSGQAPDMFKAVVARNPVIDISVMFGTSDIPDCRNALTKEEKIAFLRNMCVVEAGYPYNVLSPDEPTNNTLIDMFVKMKKCSPIVHADKVKAPTLVCIGTKDLRVPSSQGTMWYQRLKINNVKTKMLVYEDNHPLSTGPVEIDHVINACLWLLEHTSVREDIADAE